MRTNACVKVDESAGGYYISTTMRLLLLLSALLTAMVGVGAPAAAAPRAACEVSVPATLAAERQAACVAASQPRRASTSDSFVGTMPAGTSVPARSVPLYAERLRV